MVTKLLLFHYIYVINEYLLNFYYKSVQNLTRIADLFRSIKLIRNFGNKLGLAWWAKIETEKPNVTYWYGPFITKRSLKENMPSFIQDISDEGSTNIKHSLVRCKKEEPLTI